MARTAFSSVTPDDAARLEKTREHFAWQENVSKRRDLSATVRLAAWALALRRNAKSGRCDPSYADIAEHMGGVSERTAIRALTALERAGLIVIGRHVGRGHRNQVTFIMPEKVTEPCQGFDAGKGDKSGPEKVTELCHPNMKRASTKPSEYRERENARAREASRSDARAPVGAASDRRTKPAADRPAAKAERGREGGRPGRRSKPAESGFLELQKIWVRPWCDDDIGVAWLEYDRLTHEVDPRVILASARKWVAAADAPRFLPSLAKWLTARGWEKPPPQRGKPRQDGPGHARHGVRRNGGKLDLAQIALAQGRRIQAERAGL